MEKILTAATIGETAEAADNVSTAIEKAGISDNYLSLENTQLKQKAAEMRKGLGLPKGKELTAALEDADTLRDSRLSALLYLLKGFILWDSKPCTDAANVLMKIADNHGGNFSRINIERESANYDSLLEDFEKPEAVAAFATLGLQTLFVDMKSAESNFKALYQQSAEIESGKTTIVAPSSIKRETQQTLNNLLDYLSTMSRSNSTVYAPLAANVDMLIYNVNSKVRARVASKNENTDTIPTK